MSLKNETVYFSKTTNQVSIDYKNYVYLDTDRLTTLLTNGIKHVELSSKQGG